MKGQICLVILYWVCSAVLAQIDQSTELWSHRTEMTKLNNILSEMINSDDLEQYRSLSKKAMELTNDYINRENDNSNDFKDLTRRQKGIWRIDCLGRLRQLREELRTIKRALSANPKCDKIVESYRWHTDIGRAKFGENNLSAMDSREIRNPINPDLQLLQAILMPSFIPSSKDLLKLEALLKKPVFMKLLHSKPSLCMGKVSPSDMYTAMLTKKKKTIAPKLKYDVYSNAPSISYSVSDETPTNPFYFSEYSQLNPYTQTAIDPSSLVTSNSNKNPLILKIEPMTINDYLQMLETLPDYEYKDYSDNELNSNNNNPYQIDSLFDKDNMPPVYYVPNESREIFNFMPSKAYVPNLSPTNNRETNQRPNDKFGSTLLNHNTFAPKYKSQPSIENLKLLNKLYDTYPQEDLPVTASSELYFVRPNGLSKYKTVGHFIKNHNNNKKPDELLNKNYEQNKITKLSDIPTYSKPEDPKHPVQSVMKLISKYVIAKYRLPKQTKNVQKPDVDNSFPNTNVEKFIKNEKYSQHGGFPSKQKTGIKTYQTTALNVKSEEYEDEYPPEFPGKDEIDNNVSVPYKNKITDNPAFYHYTLPEMNNGEAPINFDNPSFNNWYNYNELPDLSYSNAYSQPNNLYPYKQWNIHNEVNNNVPFANQAEMTPYLNYRYTYPASTHNNIENNILGNEENSHANPYTISYLKPKQQIFNSPFAGYAGIIQAAPNALDYFDLNQKQNPIKNSVYNNDRFDKTPFYLKPHVPVRETNWFKLAALEPTQTEVELIFMLKSQKPVVYWPTYYLTYKVPSSTLLKDMNKVQNRKPYMSTSQEMLDLVKAYPFSSISPELKSLENNELRKLLSENGLLVAANVYKNDVKINDDENLINVARNFENITKNVKVDAAGNNISSSSILKSNISNTLPSDLSTNQTSSVVYVKYNENDTTSTTAPSNETVDINNSNGTDRRLFFNNVYKYISAPPQPAYAPFLLKVKKLQELQRLENLQQAYFNRLQTPLSYQTYPMPYNSYKLNNLPQEFNTNKQIEAEQYKVTDNPIPINFQMNPAATNSNNDTYINLINNEKSSVNDVSSFL